LLCRKKLCGLKISTRDVMNGSRLALMQGSTIENSKPQ